jgi:acyl carrier protein
MLETYLLQWLRNSLQLSANELNSQQSFATLLDSLLALMFKSQIESDLELQVPMENFLVNNTVARLAEQLLPRLTLADLVASQPFDSINSGAEERDKLSI